MGEQTSVPALERGLDILESVAASGKTGYSELVEKLGLPPASAARLLKCLCHRGYLRKSADSGMYTIGRAPRKLVAGPAGPEELRLAGLPVLEQLRDLTRNTAILFHWNGVVWECVAKAAHEDSITMQKVGEIRADVFQYPWGTFACSQLLKEKRKPAVKEDKARLERDRKQFEKNGFVRATGKTFTRYAVPVLTSSGDLLGALAMGVVHAGGKFDESAVTALLTRSRSQLEETLRRR